MPGLSNALSKLGLGKHRKTASTSSAGSSGPASPRQSTEAARTPASPRTRRSGETPRIPSRPAPPPPVPAAGDLPLARDSVVIIGKDGDEVGRERGDAPQSPVFADESERPELPTTVSNVNNPVPGTKSLPPVPTKSPRRLSDVSQVSPDLQPRFVSSIPSSPPRLPEIAKSPPLHHVTSIDRTALLDEQRDRPRPAVAASHGLEPMDEDAVQGRHLPHVQRTPRKSTDAGTSGSPLKKDPRIMEGLDVIASGAKPAGPRQSLDGIEIPQRGVSKRQSELVDKPIGTRVTHDGQLAQPETAATSLEPRDDLRSVRGPDTDGSKHIADHLARMSLHPTPARAGPSVPLSQMGLVPGPELEVQRDQLVRDVAGEARERKAGQPGVSDFGRSVFDAAGMGDKLDTKDSVDVHTKWLEPVVQEHVIRKEHTEYTTVIDREIHKYHVYPKIQPISDPNPIQLQPRHRIFSPADGQWHEVVGDDAAIAILGADVFHNGPKEVRETRGMALPGFGDVTPMTEEERRAAGLGSYGGGRVIQREGVEGRMGEWKEIVRGAGGEVFGDVADDGEKTAGVAI